MGTMTTLRILRQLVKEWTLPDEMTIVWDPDNPHEVAIAAKTFHQYLGDGWIAYSDEPSGKRQIFKFNPNLQHIVLIPPLGGG